MQNIVGQIASQKDFYYRKAEIDWITKSLQAGANIQLCAPRRVGKSSILFYLKDKPLKGYHFIYVDVESARTKNEFYRKVYKEVLKSEALTTAKKFWEQIKAAKNNFLKNLKGVSLGSLGSIDFNELEIDYEEELLNLLCGIDLEQDKLVIMIDEFPEVILNIVQDNNGNNVEARRFLQSNREFRHNAEIRAKIQFIYTGSNSLNITVANLNSSSLINDLNSIPVKPLNPEEAKDLVTKVLTNYGYKIAPQELDHFIAHVEWLIPFYLQLIMQEIINQIESTQDITINVIDEAFIKVLDQRNDHHFDHYVKRLKRLFVENELLFVIKLLNAIATQTTISKDEAINISTDLISESAVRRIIGSLTHDGYIIAEKSNLYKFNSPILKNWWYNHEC